MDSVRAKRFEAELLGSTIAEWRITRRINHGKSALVFLGERDGAQAAVKIFDREIVERYGDRKQDSRLALERDLVDVVHPNLVQIFDAGVDPASDLRYVIMEYLNSSTIEDTVVDPETPFIDYKEIPSVLKQLVEAAQFLESRKLVHRDIKPSNIVYFRSGRVVLLDFGVLRIIGQPGETDSPGDRPFIGTLQYGPPEFVLREEGDDLEAWRAITFYQLGAVLHDLIMREPLFHGVSPYTVLEQAVLNREPVVANPDVHPDLIALCKACLVKSAYTRLQLVSWASFNIDESGDGRAQAKERFLRRSTILQAARQAEAAVKETEAAMNALCRQCCEIVVDSLRSLTSGAANSPRAMVHMESDIIVCDLDDLEKYRLGESLVLRYSVRPLEVASRAVKVEVNVTHSSHGAEKQFWSTEVFKGVMDPGQLFAAVEAALYEILDEAQRRVVVKGGEST